MVSPVFYSTDPASGKVIAGHTVGMCLALYMSIYVYIYRYRYIHTYRYVTSPVFYSTGSAGIPSFTLHPKSFILTPDPQMLNPDP